MASLRLKCCSTLSNPRLINAFALEKIGLKPIWVICPMDIQLDCSLADKITDYEVLDEKNFNRINGTDSWNRF